MVKLPGESMDHLNPRNPGCPERLDDSAICVVALCGSFVALCASFVALCASSPYWNRIWYNLKGPVWQRRWVRRMKVREEEFKWKASGRESWHGLLLFLLVLSSFQCSELSTHSLTIELRLNFSALYVGNLVRSTSRPQVAWQLPLSMPRPEISFVMYHVTQRDENFWEATEKRKIAKPQTFLLKILFILQTGRH